MKPDSQDPLPEWIQKKAEVARYGNSFSEIREKTRDLLLTKGLPSKEEEFYRETPLQSEFKTDPAPPLSSEGMDLIAAPPEVVITRVPGQKARPAGDLTDFSDGYQNLFWQQVQQGSWIEIPSKRIDSGFIYIGSENKNAKVAYRQIAVGSEAECRIMIDFTHSKHLFTEIYVEEGANVEITWKHNAPQDWLLAHTVIHQAKNSTVKTVGFILNALTFRHNLKVILSGENGSHEAYGLALGVGEQHIDNHINMCHMAPKCHSLQLYKSILSAKSTGVFCGRILVAPQAQETEAYQQSRNLLIADTALMKTRPQLEIYADNVKCSHGATTGELRDDALFYLRSRGIGHKEAKQMLTVAFAQEVISASGHEPSQKEAVAALEALFGQNE